MTREIVCTVFFSCSYNIFSFICVLLCNLFFIFTSYHFCVPIKSPSFLNVPPHFKTDKICFYKFIWLQILINILIIIIIIIIIVITFIIIIVTIYFFLVLLLSWVFIYFQCFQDWFSKFYHSALDLCINQMFHNFKHMIRPNIGQSLQ